MQESHIDLLFVWKTLQWFICTAKFFQITDRKPCLIETRVCYIHHQENLNKLERTCKKGKKSYLLGSIVELRFTILGPNFWRWFLSQPTHLGKSITWNRARWTLREVYFNTSPEVSQFSHVQIPNITKPRTCCQQPLKHNLISTCPQNLVARSATVL